MPEFSDQQCGCHMTQVATGETGLLANEKMANRSPLECQYLWISNGCQEGGTRILRPNARSAVKSAVTHL